MKGKYILKNMIFTAVTASLIGSSIVVPVADDSNTAPSAPTGLLTNELNDPLNVENPTFGWIVNDSDFNEVQTAYEIIVTDGVTGEIAWDSGKVESSEQSYVACGGALKEGYPYSWRVKTWDKNGAESPYSEEAAFATGISDESWDADWISDGTGGAAVTQGKYNHFWYVRGSGTLENGKTIAKAMGYFAGCQDYDLYINGEEIGRGQSFDYASETRYQGWDITEAVKKDSNTLTAGAIVRTYGPGQGRAATDAAFIGRINVYYTDGTSSVITTSSDWTVSTSVPFSGTTTRNGEGDFVEKYNAANAQDGFSTDDFDAAGWTPAVVLGTNTTSEITSITPELSKPTSYEVHPVSVTVLDDGTTVADFGTVIPARPCIVFKNGTAGREIQLQGSYVLLSTGAVNSTANGTQDTDMRWVYTQKAGEQTYNAWDHLAFRYLSIPACGEAFTTDTITAKVVHTNVPEDRDSTLETSNTMLNSVFELMKRSSLYSVQNSFVDTPTREKGQFLQDSINISEASMATVFEREASRKAIDQFICSMERFWTDSDGTLNGHINSVYPNGDGQRDIPDFTVNFPYWIWNYYMTTGDKATLEKAYPYAKAVADYISKYISSETGLVTKLDGGNNAPNSYQYGIVDWPESGRFGYDWTNTKNGARSTVNMISKRAFDVVSNMAEVIGNSADQADMENRSAAIKAAINNKLLNSDGLFCDGLNSNGEQVAHVSQHANSYALAFDIAPEENRAAMAEYVAGLGMQQGPMTADILAKGLFSSGEYAAALKLFTEPEDYGWAKEIKKGYSFTFESWKADTSSDSQSHGWGATAAADILENFAGVSNLAPGASKVRIAPVYTALTSLNASVSTERGAVKVSYTRDEASYDIAITVPANVTAELDLPIIGSGQFIEKNGNAGEGTMGIEYQTINLGSGSYEFTYSGEITVQPEEVEYSPERDVIQGIAGSADTEKKIYTYEIGDGIADIAGTTYSDTSKYIDLTVSLAANDALYEEIQFAGASIGETNSVNDTKRALIARPKADGTLSLTIGFPSATSSKKCRIYYYDFENGDYDLSVCTKANGTIAGSDFTSSTEGVRTIDMKAGHVYVIYTYQTQSNISAIAYAYTEEPEDATQAPSEPTATKQPADGQDSVLNGKYMHISFDDVYACLKDITDNEYGSVFENSFLADLKSLHDSFGAVFTLNCFNKYSSDSSYSISDLPDRYSQELAANSDWLKFAFHAEDDKTQYTAQVVSGRTNGTAEELKASYESFRDAVMKATGNNAASIDTVTRLGFFAGDADCVDAICELGVTGLLTADDTRASYYFDEALNNYIIANNDYYDTVKNLRLIRSQLRLESVKDTQSALSALEGYNGNMLEIFTHEQEYTGNVPARLRAYVEWAYNNGYAFDYAMNVPGELMK
ncbi:MAG: family 78 glycoside hydrolase catalytic domain, partial [Candidatus Ornithomonoglobus sp.]